MIFGGGSSGAIGTGVVINLYDSFSANADKIANKFKTLDGLAEESAQRIEMAGNKMKLGFGAMVVGAAISAPLIGAARSAMEFETGMAKINTTAQMSKENLGKLREELLTIGAGSVGEIGKVPEAFEKIISQTGDAALSLDIIKTATKGAQAGFTEIDTVAGALAQTLSIVGKENTNAATVMDTLFAAKRVGAGEFKDFAQYLPTLIAAGSNLGLTFDKTAGVFAYFTGKGQDAANSAMLMQNAFAALQKTDIQKGLAAGGVKVFDDQGKMRGLVDIFKDLNAVTGKMSQEQKTDFLAKVGLKDVQARNAFAIMASDVGKLQEAMAATANPAGELANALAFGVNPAQEFEIAINSLKAGFISVGYSLMPLVSGAAYILGKVFGFVGYIFSAIANNPIGSFLLKLVGVVGLLTMAFGAAVVAANLKRWAVGQLASSFVALGKAEVAQIFLSQGLAAGFRAVAASVAPLLVELLPFIAVGAAIAAVFFLVKNSMSSFSDVLEGTAKPAGGLLGIMQKIGGVIYSAMEIWRGATSEGFTLSEKTAQALEGLGIYDFVVNLGTWLVRLKGFFSGLWEGISGVYSAVKTVASGIWNALKSVSLAFGWDLSKTTSDMQGWIKVGKVLGYIIGTVLVGAALLWAASMASAAIATIVALAPLFLLIGVVYAVYYAFTHWGEIVDWLGAKLASFGSWVMGIFSGIGSAIVSAFSVAWEYIKGFISWYFSLPATFLGWGVSAVGAIWQGISSSWEWLKQQLIGLISTLPGGSILLDMFGGGEGGAGATAGGGAGTSPSALGVAAAQGKVALAGAGAQGAGAAGTNSSRETLQTVNLVIDGKQLKTRMDKIDKQDESRR